MGLAVRICWPLSQQNERPSQMYSSLLGIFAWLAVHICPRNHDSTIFSSILSSSVFILLRSNGINKLKQDFILIDPSTCDVVRFPAAVRSGVTWEGNTKLFGSAYVSGSFESMGRLGLKGELELRNQDPRCRRLSFSQWFVVGKIIDAAFVFGKIASCIILLIIILRTLCMSLLGFCIFELWKDIRHR